jgi:hypothetical protein
MGMHGLSSCASGRSWIAGRWSRRRFTLIAAPLALLPALTACSGFSSSGFGGPGPARQTAAVPPSNPAAAVAPEPALSPAATTGVYPSQSLADFFKSDSTPAARTANVPHPPSTYTAADQPYAPSRSYGAVPTSTLAPTIPPSASPDTSSNGVYPSVSLADYFKSDSTPARTANVPHPPSTYTPVDQPYAPPSGQPVYGSAPAAAPPAAAAAPTNSDPAASGAPYPQQSLWDLFSK